MVRFNIEVLCRPPYEPHTRVVNYTTTEPETFVRVHGSGNQTRPWVMRAEDIKGLSPAQIKAKYNLPDIPTKVSEVKVPPGTDIRSEMIGKNKFGNSEGAVQYEIIMPEGKEVPKAWFNGVGDL